MLLLIWADEKYNTPKNPCVVFATQKNPGVFHRPKKIPFGQKWSQTPKNPSDPPSLKYVSGARGTHWHWGSSGKSFLQMNFMIFLRMICLYFQIKDVLLWCLWWPCWSQGSSVCCWSFTQEHYSQVSKRLMVNTIDNDWSL